MRVTDEADTYIRTSTSNILTRTWRSPGRLCTPEKPSRVDKSRRASQLSVDPVTLCRPETRNVIAVKIRVRENHSAPSMSIAALIRRPSFVRQRGEKEREKEREEKRENEKVRENTRPLLRGRGGRRH